MGTTTVTMTSAMDQIRTITTLVVSMLRGCTQRHITLRDTTALGTHIDEMTDTAGICTVGVTSLRGALVTPTTQVYGITTLTLMVGITPSQEQRSTILLTIQLPTLVALVGLVDQ